MQTAQRVMFVLMLKLLLVTIQKLIHLLFQTTQLLKATVYVVVLFVLQMLTKICYVLETHVTLVKLHSVMALTIIKFRLLQLIMLLHLTIRLTQLLIELAILVCQLQDHLLQLRHTFKTALYFHSWE